MMGRRSHSETKTLKPYNVLIDIYAHFTKSVQKIAETAELVRGGITNLELEALRYFDWPDNLSYARWGRRWWWNWNRRQIGIIAWLDVQYYSCRAILLPSGGQNINTQWRIRNVCFAPSPLPTKLSLCICEWESSSSWSANHLQGPKTFPVKNHLGLLCWNWVFHAEFEDLVSFGYQTFSPARALIENIHFAKH